METLEDMLARWKSEFPADIFKQVELQVRSYAFQLKNRDESIDRLNAEVSELRSKQPVLEGLEETDNVSVPVSVLKDLKAVVKEVLNSRVDDPNFSSNYMHIVMLAAAVLGRIK